MNSIVTQRFLQCFEKIRKENKVRSNRQFAFSIDYLPQSLNSILKDKRDVPLETLRKAILKYGFNPTYIFTGEGPKLIDAESTEGFKVLSLTVNREGDERIVHVPVPAQAEYANESAEQNFIQGLPSFSLPDYRFKVGTHRSFDVGGDSMEPTLSEGDKVICSFLEPNLWEHGIKHNQVYVFVTKTEVLIKRAHNKIKENSTLELHSDNAFYDNLSLPLSELKEVWMIRSTISPFMSGVDKNEHKSTVSKDDMIELKNSIEKQNEVINNLYKAIDNINQISKS